MYISQLSMVIYFGGCSPPGPLWTATPPGSSLLPLALEAPETWGNPPILRSKKGDTRTSCSPDLFRIHMCCDRFNWSYSFDGRYVVFLVNSWSFLDIQVVVWGTTRALKATIQGNQPWINSRKNSWKFPNLHVMLGDSLGLEEFPGDFATNRGLGQSGVIGK